MQERGNQLKTFYYEANQTVKGLHTVNKQT